MTPSFRWISQRHAFTCVLVEKKLWWLFELVPKPVVHLVEWKRKNRKCKKKCIFYHNLKILTYISTRRLIINRLRLDCFHRCVCKYALATIFLLLISLFLFRQSSYVGTTSLIFWTKIIFCRFKSTRNLFEPVVNFYKYCHNFFSRNCTYSGHNLPVSSL